MDPALSPVRFIPHILRMPFVHLDIYILGKEFTDTLTLDSGMTISKQSIGVSDKVRQPHPPTLIAFFVDNSQQATGFDGVDGIVG